MEKEIDFIYNKCLMEVMSNDFKTFVLEKELFVQNVIGLLLQLNLDEKSFNKVLDSLIRKSNCVFEQRLRKGK